MKNSIDNLNEEEYKALSELAKDRSIVISKADKGNDDVIQNVTEYRTKLFEILKFDGKFRKMSESYEKKIEKTPPLYTFTKTRQGRYK